MKWVIIMLNNLVESKVRKWVGEFNAIPQSVVEKLWNIDEYCLEEITPPSEGDRVYVVAGEYGGEQGVILEAYTEEYIELYLVELDTQEKVELPREDLEVEHYDFLPMWGTMWTFGNSLDNYWIEQEENLQKMANCGFRIYEQEDFGYIFGIDGAGYDFFESHWAPLYLARGLKWHEEG